MIATSTVTAPTSTGLATSEAAVRGALMARGGSRGAGRWSGRPAGRAERPSSRPGARAAGRAACRASSSRSLRRSAVEQVLDVGRQRDLRLGDVVLAGQRAGVGLALAAALARASWRACPPRAQAAAAGFEPSSRSRGCRRRAGWARATGCSARTALVRRRLRRLVLELEQSSSAVRPTRAGCGHVVEAVDR